MNELIGNPIQIVGEVCLRKRRRKRQKKLLKKLFEDYSKNTTLHGLRYTTENGLHVAEKIFWLVLFAVSVALSFYLISKVWIKWTTSPVIVSFSGKPVFVNEVPFPAVTICPATKFLQSTFNYTKVQLDLINAKNRVDNKTLAISDAVNLICDVPNMKTEENTTNSLAVETLLNVTVDSRYVIGACELHTRSCKTLFNRVLTDDGICFTFNGLAARSILNFENIQREYNYSEITEDIKDWTLEKGYNINSNDDTYPFRGQESVEKAYMRLILMDLEKEKDKMCNAVLTGYKIYLHHPSEWPQAMTYYFAALPQQVSSMAVKFTMVTSDDLKSVALEIRQCYFQHEKPLKYFNIYTYNHCRFECLTNYTYQKCGCVLYHMPFNDSTKICSSKNSLQCAMNATDEFAVNGGVQLKDCNCRPACDYIQYDAEVHKTNFNVDDFLEGQYRFYGEQYERGSASMASVDISFKDPMVMAVHRSELFGITDFLGICGGLLGLFLGFSFLSLVEIFYFLTFRVFKTIRSDLKNEKRNSIPAIFFQASDNHIYSIRKDSQQTVP